MREVLAEKRSISHEEIRNLLIKTGIDRVESIADTDSMLEAGILDSLQTLELITSLESNFSIKIEDREVIPENLDSIAGIAAFVVKKVADGRG